MLISDMPALACAHTYGTYTLSFRTLQSTGEGGDVILSAAAPAEEASEGEERERNIRSEG